MKAVLTGVLCMFACVVHAMEYQETADTLVLRGSIDHGRDSSELKRLLSGKTYLVLQNVNPSSNEASERISNIIAGYPVTTVIDGRCNNKCSALFLAARTRLFGARVGDVEPAYVFVTRWAGSGGGVQSFALYSRRFPRLPLSLRMRHMSWGDGYSGLAFHAPDAAHPKGRILECSNARTQEGCKPRDDLDLLRIGLISRLEPYVLPAEIALPLVAATEQRPAAP